MLDWKEPLALDAIVDRGLVIFNATLPRVGLFAVLAGLAVNLLGEQLFGPHEQEIAAMVSERRLDELLERFGIALAGLSVLLLFVNSAVLHLVGALARQQPADPWTSLAVALRKLPHLLIGGVLYFVALWCGMLLLLVPGIWAAVALSFFVQAVLFDDRDGLRALATSARLVRGHWWRTFALYLLVVVALLIALLMAGLVVNLVAGLVGLVAGGRLPLLELVVSSTIGAVLGLVVDGVLVAYFHDLVLRRGDAPPRDEGALVV
jgi:hypothetical protein